MDDPHSAVVLHHVPELQAPYLIAAWSGMGAVALLAVNYLRQELHARPFGEIDPHPFYAPTNVAIQDGLIQPIAFPETKLYSWERGTNNDLMILVGTEQPTNALPMAVQIVAAAKELGVQRVYTTAAFPTLIHHTQEPAVWGTATHDDLIGELGEYGVRLMDQGTIGGLNGLLLSVAKEQGLRGLCLLGEIPLYATQMINPRASHAVLSVLMDMLDLDFPLDKLDAWTQDLAPQMDKLYEILPDHAKEAFRRGETTTSQLASPSPEGEQPLVADDAFFREIEQFLEQHKRPPDDAGGEEIEPDDTPS